MIPRLSLTLDEAAEAVGVKRDTVRAWIERGTLTAKKTGSQGGGKFLILVADLEAALAALEDA